jgi:hypothetical protein
MSRALEVNSIPVDSDEHTTFTALNEEFVAPAACIGCIVLNAKRTAESIGMVVPPRAGGYEYFPPSKIPELKSTLVQRADDSISGACKFILQQECWRVEKVEE